MAELVVIVPSRGRPGQAAELAEVCSHTCSADTRLVIAVDADDPALPDYDRALLDYGSAYVAAVDPPAGHVGAINAGAREALRWKSRPYALAKLDDDHRPRTKGWDAMMLAALDQMGGAGIVYGNDLLQGQNLPTAPVISTNIVQALGYMGPPCLTHLYVDNFWLDLGRQAGCLRYLPEVVIEHMHPMAGKAAVDDGYQRVNAPQQYAADGGAYERYAAGQLLEDVAKVRELAAMTVR